MNVFHHPSKIPLDISHKHLQKGEKQHNNGFLGILFYLGEGGSFNVFFLRMTVDHDCQPSPGTALSVLSGETREAQNRAGP